MGKEDKDGGGVGVVWDQDIDHVEKMCNELSQIHDLGEFLNIFKLLWIKIKNEKAFIMVAGDLAHALPNDDEGFKSSEHGDLPPLRSVVTKIEPLFYSFGICRNCFRSAQSIAFLDAMRLCPDVPIFTVAGNRDIGNNVARKDSWTGYESQFMDSYYYFKFGERYYISKR